MNPDLFNWQRKDWPSFTFARAALKDELAAFARHRRAYYDELNVASRTLDWTAWAGFFVPVLAELLEGFVSAAPNDEPIDGINDAILRLVRLHPGRGVPFFLASIKASPATVERAVRALVRAGRIEHRGSRKTGGYYATPTTP